MTEWLVVTNHRIISYRQNSNFALFCRDFDHRNNILTISEKLALPVVVLFINDTLCWDGGVTVGPLICTSGK